MSLRKLEMRKIVWVTCKQLQAIYTANNKQ